MVDLLNKEVTQLKKKILKQQEVISSLQEREQQLQFRLSEQARRQMEKGSGKFEDLSLGNNRPTQLIKRFGNLYSEGRVEALDALEEMDEVKECEKLKNKLLLSILVLSFRSTQKTLMEIKLKLRQTLNIPKNVTSSLSPPSSLLTSSLPPPPSSSSSSSSSLAAKDLEDEVSIYLRKTVHCFNLKKNVKEVTSKIFSTLHDFPQLSTCKPLIKYTEECVAIAWALTVQNPPITIDYETSTFVTSKHSRFHSSDAGSDVILSCLWPALDEGGVTVCKGIVLT